MNSVANPIQVLHVDDEPDFADLTADLVEREDERITVKSVLSASEGLSQLSEGNFDCVVSDYDMPEKNGIEFLETVREDFSDLPFILFTGKGSEEIASEAISAGVTDYLQKEGGTGQYSVLANRVINAVNRRRTKQDLRASEQRYRQLLEAAPVPILLYSESLEVSHANEAAVEFLTADHRNDLIGKHATEFAHPENEHRVRSRLQQVVSNREPMPATEVAITALDGSEKYAIVSSTAGTYKGEPVVQTVAYDITEQKEQEANYEAIFENIPEGIVLHDAADGSFIDMNTKYVEMFGYDSKNEFLEAGFEAIHPDDPPYTLEQAWEQLKQAISKGSHTFEWPGVRKDGSQFWAEVHLALVELNGEERVLAAVRNITERKNRKQELERYHQIVRELDDIATIIDPDGRIEYVSPSVKRVLGYEPQELIGENGFRYQPSETQKAVAEALDHVLENPDESETVQTQFKRADGSYCWIESTLRNRLEDELINGILVSSREISERVKDRQKLQRQNQRLEEFASVVSHDLRNPLSVAQGRLRLAQEERDWEHLESVTGALDRMEKLIEDMLSLANAGEAIGELEAVALSDLADTCWQNIETDSATLQVDSDLTIQADRSRLQQLLENLLRNAVEHGGDDVTVTIDELSRGFYVEDDGPGIQEDERTEVLEPGYSTREDGTGFGLSIVREIAQAHGWEISVTEGSLGGARFEFRGVQTV